MSGLSVFAVLTSLAAALSFANHRLLRLPATVGILVLSLGMSVLLLAVDPLLGGVPHRWATDLLRAIDPSQALLHGVLAFLLFAGALQVDLRALWDRRWVVLTLSTLSVLIATGVFGGAFWLVMGALGRPVPLLWCLVLGAVLSATDPVVLAAALRRIDMPEDVRAAITGESLFNDGVAIAVFLLALGAALGQGGPEAHDPWSAARRMLGDAGGAAVLGLALGGAALWALRRTHDYGLELTITLALASGSYALAEALRLSAAIAVVAAGLVVGGSASVAARAGRSGAAAAATDEETAAEAIAAADEASRQHVMIFWEMVDHVLNALLFLLLGLVLLSIEGGLASLLAATVAIPIALAARFVSVAAPALALPLGIRDRAKAVGVLTWGGLRGGIAVALALSIPAPGAGEWRGHILVATYAVVLCNLVLQGLTLGPLLRRLYGEAPSPSPESGPDRPA